MDVEEIDLDFSHTLGPIRCETYAFAASHLLEDSEKKASHLTRFCLKNCSILSSVSPPVCKRSWLSRLTTLDLCNVPLRESDVDCILLFLHSGSLHLTTLLLLRCCLPSTFCVDGQLVCMKKLVIEDNLDEIKLNCPNLEEFEYWGLADVMTFVCVPKLRKADVLLVGEDGNCSWIFDELTRKAPQLEALSLNVRTEVQPLLLNITRARLRKLDLRAVVPKGFDILTITYMLNASPFLEIFHLEFMMRIHSLISPRREYPNRLRFRLREVEITSYSHDCHGYVDLALYLMRNAVVLKQMVLAFRDTHASRWKEDLTNTLVRNKFNPGAQVIIQEIGSSGSRLFYRV